jgi:hypothetical protein
MGEVDSVAVDGHDRVPFGLIEQLHEAIGCEVGGLGYQLHRRIGEAGHRKQRTFGVRADPADHRAHQLAEAARQAQFIVGLPGADFARQFQCIKGISTGDLMDAQQRGPGDRTT